MSSPPPAARPGLFRQLTSSPLHRVALVVLGFVVLLSVVAPVLPFPDPAHTDLSRRLLPPGSLGHLFGTDRLGRDLLSRLLEGTRLSLLVALVGSTLATVTGSALGLVAGYLGRFIDAFAMRSLDVLLAFPYLLLAIAIVAALGPGLPQATLAIAVANLPFFARTVRGVTLSIKNEDFVLAARVSGVSRLGIAVKELLPNVLPTIAVAFSASVGWVLLETAGLSFLGLGAQPPVADLGGMLGEGRELLAIAPHVALIPGGVILVLVAALNVTGDALRDALDPRQAPGPLPPRAAAEAAPGGEPRDDAPETPLVVVRDLTLAFGDRRVLDGVSFSLRRGERVALVGESGSGKSLTTRALLGLVPPGAALTGEVSFAGTSLFADEVRARAVRGSGVALVPQDPQGSLHPLFRIDDQLGESLDSLDAAARRERVERLLAAVELPEPPALARRFPHQLSGGMRQRVAIAMALSGDPKLMVLDEPTTALDVTTQAAILALLRGLSEKSNTALLFVTHDLAVASALCERVIVMSEGRVVDAGSFDGVFREPGHAATRRLFRAAVRRSGGHAA